VNIIAIDPGTTQSAMVQLFDGKIISHEIANNKDVIYYLRTTKRQGVRFGIEMVASYGMPVGKDIFETVLWIGRFIEAWQNPYQSTYRKIYRKDVKMFLCNNTRAKDSNIRQALLDLYPATGGGKTPQVGTKKDPGPLYGFKADEWAALGVALTYQAILQGKYSA